MDDFLESAPARFLGDTLHHIRDRFPEDKS